MSHITALHPLPACRHQPPQPPGATSPEVRAGISAGMEVFALDPDAVARAVLFCVGDLTIRPAVQG